MSKHESLELQIDELAGGGAGVARDGEGRVVFVHGAVPGDRVQARITRRRSSFAEAEILEVLEASSHRRERSCPLADRCGGCPWQHVDYSEQVAAKKSLLENAMRRVAEVVSFSAAPAELGYRRRARFTWERRGRKLTLGFARWRSRDLVDVECCPVLVPALQEALAALRAHLNAWKGEGRGSALLLHGREGVHLSLRVDQGAPPIGPRQDPIVGGMLWRRDRVLQRWGMEAVSLDERPLSASAGAFTQANAEQDECLRGWISEWTGEEPGPILELYGGVGNLTSALAHPERAVTVVESSPEAIRWFKKNIGAMEGRVTLMEGEAEGATHMLLAQGASFAGVVLDPPREGAKEVMASILQLRPGWIIYVSCDPMTLARDLGTLSAGGYAVEALRGLDMMPQSTHIEAAALLRLDNTEVAG
ncbi:MAG: class I SAM-dependent RNA methyltransferase [Deltaproteobacteria bacterium]|nr:class I SAM-dependent RNA methyltransferase [Deltaproteobacteria bacterium]